MPDAAARQETGRLSAADAPRIDFIQRVKTIGTVTREGTMKTTMRRGISALLMATALADCGMLPAQNMGTARTQAAPPASASAPWAKVMELDRQSVSHGYLPPEVIRYDLQIAQMIPEGEPLIASQDKAKARVRPEKWNAIQTARSRVIEKSTAIALAKSQARSLPVVDGQQRVHQARRRTTKRCQLHGGTRRHRRHHGRPIGRSRRLESSADHTSQFFSCVRKLLRHRNQRLPRRASPV
jgi:hypothetical protein